MTNLSQVIEWKLKKLGKLEGANVGTKDGALTYWAVKEVEYPNEATIDLWNQEYIVENNKPVPVKEYTLEQLIINLRAKGLID